jgi:hypothetical protein
MTKRAMRSAIGFTLIELLVYLVITTSIIMLTVQWIAQSHSRLTQHAMLNKNCIGMCAAHDVLMRDVRAAPTAHTAWKEIGPHAWIWRTGQEDIGWELRKGQVRRMTGLYDMSKHAWSKHHTSVIAQDIAVLLLELKRGANNEIIAVRVRMESELPGHVMSMDRTLFVRQGMRV